MKAGDTLIEVDLPANRNENVWRYHQRDWNINHLSSHKKEFAENLPEGVTGEAVYADAQKLPFRDGQIDIVFMGNVFSGHVKDDELEGFEASPKRVLRQKLSLI